MKTQVECYPCLLRHTLQMLAIAAADQVQQQRVVQQVLGEFSCFDTERSPPEMAHRIHQIVRRETGTRDPYLAVKERCTREALALYPRLQALVADAADPLEIAIRVSIAGNIIDAGISLDYDLGETLTRVIAEPFAIQAFAGFRRLLEASSQVLFLADNAGETVFDRVLIEVLEKPVTYVVKGGPILNDATLEDARGAGILRVATVVDNGSDAPGTVLRLCSRAFQATIAEAEVIIAKGQANYETLSGVKAPLFFLLQAKCSAVARDLGVAVNSIVFTTTTN